MRIAFIHPRYPSAEGTGATHSATQIVSGLCDAGHDVSVYCARSSNNGALTSEFETHHLTGNSNHPHTSTRLNKEILARVDELREYDIVHSYIIPLMPSIAKVGKSSDVGTVVTLNAYGGTCAKNDLLYLNREHCHNKSTLKCLHCIARTGFDDNQFGFIHQTGSRVFSLRLINSGERRLDSIDRFRAPSEHVKQNYVQFGYDPGKITVIPHPVDEDFLISHESGFSAPYNLLYVGALKPHKGVDKLIPILSSLNQTDTTFTLTIVGTGGLENMLREQAEEYDVAETVTFLGFVPNKQLPAVYASHDCFVYPGIWEEPLARVYIESLATGTPIVTTEYGSIGEIVGDAGRLTDGSVASFHETIEGIVTDDELSKMSKAATDEVEKFDRDKIVEQLVDVYQSL